LSRSIELFVTAAFFDGMKYLTQILSIAPVFGCPQWADSGYAGLFFPGESYILCWTNRRGRMDNVK
jgi:hypothetical protein